MIHLHDPQEVGSDVVLGYWRKENWPRDMAMVFEGTLLRCDCGQEWFRPVKKDYPVVSGKMVEVLKCEKDG